MKSYRWSRTEVSFLGPGWILTSIVLISASLVLPAPGPDTLLCLFCPLQHRGTSCPNITSRCLPWQRCSSSRGHFGPIHVLSAQGCLDAELCGSHQILSHRGVHYNVSHTCCCADRCNVPPKAESSLKMLLERIAHKMKTSNITSVSKEEPWDSCANYTSPVP